MFRIIEAISKNWINKVIGGTPLVKAIFLKKIENDKKSSGHKPKTITLNTEFIIRNSTKKQILIN